MHKKPTTAAPAWLVSLRDEADARCVTAPGVDLHIRLAPPGNQYAKLRDVPAVRQAKRIESGTIWTTDRALSASIEVAASCAISPPAHPIWSIITRRASFCAIVIELLRIHACRRLPGVRLSFPEPRSAGQSLQARLTGKRSRASERALAWMGGLDAMHRADGPLDLLIDVHLVDLLGTMIDASRAHEQPAPPDTDERNARCLVKLITDQSPAFRDAKEIAKHPQCPVGTREGVSRLKTLINGHPEIFGVKITTNRGLAWRVETVKGPRM